MNDNIIIVTDENFKEQVLEAEKPVLIDFWAEWCGPCKALAPELKEIAEIYHDKVIVGKIDVDKNTLIPGEYNIRGIPSLLLFKNGKVIGTRVGSATKAQISSFIDANIED